MSNTIIPIDNFDFGNLIDTRRYLTCPTSKSSKLLITKNLNLGLQTPILDTDFGLWTSGLSIKYTDTDP